MERKAFVLLVALVGMTACLRVLNCTVRGETVQLVGDDVTLYQAMLRSEPLAPAERCPYWAAADAEARAPLPLLIPAEHTPNLKRVVADQRERACGSPR